MGGNSKYARPMLPTYRGCTVLGIKLHNKFMAQRERIFFSHSKNRKEMYVYLKCIFCNARKKLTTPSPMNLQ